MITHCISTYYNLEYLKLAVESVRKNSYYSKAPFIVHSDESNQDGTIEWLLENKNRYNLTVSIKELDPTGIGQGMNHCASLVETEYINFLHSDFYVTKNWDLELYKVHLENPNEKLWVNSLRVEPNMFKSFSRYGTVFVPEQMFGGYYNNFNKTSFEEWIEDFKQMNEPFSIPKGEGVSGMVKKSVWDEVGGNDPIFAPTSWDDHDLFLRMLQHGVRFVQPSHSLVWHFGARGSHRLEENGGKSSTRQIEAERKNIQNWIQKWGKLPEFDSFGMIKQFSQ